MKEYSVRVNYTHRRFGPGMGRTINTKGSSFKIGIARAVEQFFRTLDRKDMNDIRRSGLRLEVREVGELAASPNPGVQTTISVGPPTAAPDPS